MAPHLTISEAIGQNDTQSVAPPRNAPLRSMSHGAMVDCTCRDCGLGRVEAVSQIVKQASLRDVTAKDLEDILRCERQGCGGELDISIKLLD